MTVGVDSLMNRRRFLQHTAAASTLGFPAITRCASPNSMLQVACVGVARMGGATMRGVASHPKAKIVALCDVDAAHMQEAATGKGSARTGGIGFPDAMQVRDWRELLTKHADKFDAITIGIPDHMHSSVCLTALRAKKHVYLQKPMAPTIHECRVLTQEAAKSGLVTQLGNQGRSSIEARMTVKLIRDGAIGKVKEIVFWENKPLNWWPKNEELRAKADAVPQGFDWNLWLGVRGERPFLEDTYHPQTWRAWRDFGVGELGDMGVHFFDATYDALKLTAPLRVRQIQTGAQKPGMWARARVVEFKFPGNEMIAGDTLKLTWHDGGVAPEGELKGKAAEYVYDGFRPKRDTIPMPKGLTKFPPSGHLWIGERGMIFKPYDQRPWVLPEENFPGEKYPRNFKAQNHYHDWVDAILEGRKSCADFSHSGPLTETVLVGTLAEKFQNEWVSWDREAMKVTNFTEANAMVKRDFRDGWKIEGLG